MLTENYHNKKVLHHSNLHSSQFSIVKLWVLPHFQTRNWIYLWFFSLYLPTPFTKSTKWLSQFDGVSTVGFSFWVPCKHWPQLSAHCCRAWSTTSDEGSATWAPAPLSKALNWGAKGSIGGRSEETASPQWDQSMAACSLRLKRQEARDEKKKIEKTLKGQPRITKVLSGPQKRIQLLPLETRMRIVSQTMRDAAPSIFS